MQHIARLYLNHRRISLQNQSILKNATILWKYTVNFQETNVQCLNTWWNSTIIDLEKSIENDLKLGNGSALFEKLEKADDSSLSSLPKRIWGSVFYNFNQNEEFEKLDKIRDKTKDLNINCGEGAYTTLIRSYVTRKQPMNAVSVLDEMKNTGLLRHTRTYFPVITSLAQNDHQEQAFELFNEMQYHTFKSKKGIALSIPPSMTVALIKSCIQSKTADYDKAKDILLWYNHSGRLLTSEVLYAVKEWLDNDPVNNWITRECLISAKGICNNCKQNLDSGQLMSNETKKLKLDIASSIENMFKLEKKAKKREQFHKYVTFLKQCIPCDVIIDGMSIGLSSNAQKRKKRFNFNTLLEVSDHFVQQGSKVLVVLNSSIPPSFLSRDVEYFITDVGDDDLFIMYACATWNMLSYFVTRDQFREHRFLLAFHNHSSYLKWIRSHTIGVGVERNTRLTFHRQIYDPVVQAGNGSWHFPQADGRWFCARKIM